MRKLTAAVIFTHCAFFAAVCAGQDVHPVSGRKIAQVMGIGGADWLTRSERAWKRNIPMKPWT